MAVGRRKRGWALALWFGALLALGYASLIGFVWISRTQFDIKSDALDEARHITVFGVSREMPRLQSVVVYALDGENHRNGLMPAAHGLVMAWLNGQPSPLVVAVHNNGKRDVDFRPVRVTPASWRPNIKGRGSAFDVFLMSELRPEIERRFGKAKRRFLFGHSLAGFYVLDMPTRSANHRFDGLFAFSPTFSHDLSLISRLGTACTNSRHLYANIGLESGRDTDIFGRAERELARNPACQGKTSLSHHRGMVHQIVMLTGQIEAFHHIYSRNE